MKLTDDDLRAIWREPAANVSSDRSKCLTDDEWTRLLAKDATDPVARERAVTHIASCRACADEYSLLQPLESWMAAVERTHSPRESRWVDRWRSVRLWSSSRPLALAEAAAIALLVTNGAMLYELLESRRQSAQLGTQLVEQQSALSEAQTSSAALRESQGREAGMKAQLDTLQERVAQLSAPQLVAGIVDLEPGIDEMVRGSTDPQIVVTAQTAPVTVVLNHAPLTTRSTLELVIEGESPEVRWTGRTPREQDSAALAVVFPAGYPAGRYILRLFDVTGVRTPLAVYSVVIQRSAAG